MIVLDTSLLSLAFRRRWTGERPAVVDQLDEMLGTQTVLAIPGIVLQEILFGIRTEPQFRETEAGLAGFPLLLARHEDHLAAAQIFNTCATGGVAVSAIDCLIAAQTIKRQALLWTLDQGFQYLARHTNLKLYRPA